MRPGHLPNNLTVAKIKTGNSNIRNPILVSYVAKGLLPYRGLGSGIKRAIDAWPGIDFIDDRDGCLFTAIVHHNKIEGSVESSVENSRDGSVEIDNLVLEQFRLEPEMTLHALAKTLGISLRATEKRVANLQYKNRLKRIGPKKGGYWQVL